ncbi:MAG: Spy/CpxP family protein refolding chaperone [Geobacter sp.]|nr:Spy/CpxP family protein refolding chaperone [Geobacter sp.]
MKKRIIIGVMAVTTLACGVWSAQAGRGPDFDGPALHDGCGERGKMDPEQRIARMTKKLKLSDAQKEQVQAIVKGEKEQVAPLMEKLKENRKALREATEVESFDEAAVKALADKQAGLQAELIVAHAKVRSRINAILTPEQRELFKKQLPKMKRGEGRKRHRGTEE